MEKDLRGEFDTVFFLRDFHPSINIPSVNSILNVFRRKKT